MAEDTNNGETMANRWSFRLLTPEVRDQLTYPRPVLVTQGMLWDWHPTLVESPETAPHFSEDLISFVLSCSLHHFDALLLAIVVITIYIDVVVVV